MGAERAFSRQPFNPDQYVSRSQVSAVLSVSEQQLRRLENRPDWPVGVMIGNRRKYLGADLLLWLESHQENGGGAPPA